MISRKGWRRVVVEQQEYYWQVRDVGIETNLYGDTFHRKLTIRVPRNPAASCVIIFAQTGYYWLGNNVHPVVITPRLVEHCIRHALGMGWRPLATKQPFIIEDGGEIWAEFSVLNDSTS